MTSDLPGDPITRIATVVEALRKPLEKFLTEQSLRMDAERHVSMQEAEKALLDSPLGPLMQDDTITDVLVNGPFVIYINRAGKLERTDVVFDGHDSLEALANMIVHAAGRSLDPNRPLADARLRDGSRVNIVAPPMAVDGLSMSIRKFPKQEITLDKLTEYGAVTPMIAAFLKLCAQSRANIVVSGGTGSGKTTMLNAVSHYIPASERIVTIEDTAELRLQQPHVVKLETKEPPIIGERRQEVNTADLVRNSLRMRPDRIIVGEVRDAAAYDMIQAMNTGHDGSMATIHANTPRDALTRIENLLSPMIQNTTPINVRRQIVSAVNMIIQVASFPDGKRRLTSIAEIVGLEGDMPTMQEIFTLKEDPTQKAGSGVYVQNWTGIMPRHPKLVELCRAANVFAMK